MTQADWVFFLAIAAMFAWAFWRGRARAAKFRRLAGRIGFHYDPLPRSLPFNGLPPLITSVWNLLDGERRGRRVIAFDCQFGEGKGSWRRTVIAVQGDASSSKAARFDPNMQVDQIGDWTFLYRARQLQLVGRQLTSLSELSAYLDVI